MEPKTSFGLSGYVWMAAIALSMAGVQFLYSIQFAAGPLLFQKNLCLDAGTANIIFATAGPLSGFIVQPVVGAFSDNHTGRFGRRRPFILMGTIGSIVGLLGMAFCQMIGTAAGDIQPANCIPNKGTQGHNIAVGLGIASLWLMNICVNVLMGPARAIINDLVEASYLVTANSIATGAMAAAAVTANLVGAAFYGPGNNFLQRNPVLMLFSVGSLVMAICSTITIIFARERQHTLKEGEKVKTVGGTFVDIYKGFRYMPLPLFFVGMLYFLSWFAYTPLMTNQTSYFVNNVYGINSSLPSASTSASFGSLASGDLTKVYDYFVVDASASEMLAPELPLMPEVAPSMPPSTVYTPATDPAYLASRRGTAMGFYSLAVFAGVQFVYSLVAPTIVKGIGLKWAYFLPQLVATASYILAPFMAYPPKHWPIPAIVAVFALVGPNFIAFNSVPFALVSGITSGASGGLYMGVLNSASVVAQTLTNTFVSLILKKTKPLPLNTPNPTQNVAWGIAFGGIFSAIACIWCLIFIRDDMVKKPEDGDISEKRPLIQNEDPETQMPAI
jgi:Na+/melibiose symporter-like transporter